ncbi:MAG: hypothetical protein NVS1B11_26670 [Terriglobales bacterium]
MLAELTADFVHMPIKLLEQILEAGKYHVEHGWVANEIVFNESMEDCIIAIFRPPELRTLPNASLQARSLSVVEFPFDPCC